MSVKEAGVAITGALGNLGTKLADHLVRSGFRKLIALDLREDADWATRIQDIGAEAGNSECSVETRACDLTDPLDERWRSAIREVGGIVHFAADNPFPEATWREAARSLDMTVNTAMAAAESAVCVRYVFATSNHVMGRYRTEGLGPGELKPETSEGVGTVWDTGDKSMDSTPYASAKFAGERICRGLGSRPNGTDFVAVRIGWCQPGANERSTLSAAGTPTQGIGSDKQDAELEATDRWFKGMWLSNPDMVHLFERALLASSENWEAGFALVNGMSDNAGMVWSLEETRSKLGYEPADNVFAN